MITDRELDAAIAGTKLASWNWPKESCEQCGWTLGEEHSNGHSCRPGNCAEPKRKVSARELAIPHYSTDRNAAALVLERIKELGLNSAMEDKLQYQFGGHWYGLMVATAPPRQWMEAALATVGVVLPAASDVLVDSIHQPSRRQD
jgi:hypothetical protein